jgi:hypothetical protein
MTPEEWADAIYEATGWIVSNGLAAAIGGMVEAARRDAAGEAGRLRDERDRLREALRRIGAGNGCMMAASNPPICSRALAARAALGEDRA